MWLKIPKGISYLGLPVDHYTLILVPKAWQFLLYFMHSFILQSFIPIMIWWECHTFSIKVVHFQCYCIENILLLSSIPPLSSEFWILTLKIHYSDWKGVALSSYHYWYEWLQFKCVHRVQKKLSCFRNQDQCEVIHSESQIGNPYRDLESQFSWINLLLWWGTYMSKNKI